MKHLHGGLDRDRESENHAWETPLGGSAEYLWNEPVNLGSARLVFDSNLADEKRMPCTYPQKAGVHRVPSSLVRAYRLETRDTSGTWKVAYRAVENIQLPRLRLRASGRSPASPGRQLERRRGEAPAAGPGRPE